MVRVSGRKRRDSQSRTQISYFVNDFNLVYGGTFFTAEAAPPW
jgi:hypothetical protein